MPPPYRDPTPPVPGRPGVARERERKKEREMIRSTAAVAAMLEASCLAIHLASFHSSSPLSLCVGERERQIERGQRDKVHTAV